MQRRHGATRGPRSSWPYCRCSGGDGQCRPSGGPSSRTRTADLPERACRRPHHDGREQPVRGDGPSPPIKEMAANAKDPAGEMSINRGDTASGDGGRRRPPNCGLSRTGRLSTSPKTPADRQRRRPIIQADARPPAAPSPAGGERMERGLGSRESAGCRRPPARRFARRWRRPWRFAARRRGGRQGTVDNW